MERGGNTGMMGDGGAQARLMVFERALSHTITRSDEIKAELDAMRLAGREKSYRFRELLSEKLVNDAMLALFRGHGLL